MADTTSKPYLARITHPDWEGNTLTLLSDWTWEISDEAESAELAMAKLLTTMYTYSPSHGRPGAILANKIADRIPGSKAEFPALPEDLPGMVY